MRTDWTVYLFVMVTIATSYLSHADDRTHDLSESKSDKRISKRDATIFIESYPIEPIYKHRPKIIYRRISKQRYTSKSPKPKYGPPIHYRSKSRKPVKKYTKGNTKPKYGPPHSYKRRPTKSKYGPPKMKYKSVYGPPKQKPVSYYSHEPAGFGEPPADETIDYPPKKHFGEPPLDSYGSAVSADVIDPYIPDHFSPPSYPDTSSFDNLDTNFDQDFRPWQKFHEQSYDNSVSYSKKRPVYVRPEPFDFHEDFDLNPYSYNEKHSETFDEEPIERKRRPYYLSETVKFKPRRQKPTPEPDDEVLVGGRYAEPPARFVPKYQQTVSLHSEDDDFVPLKGFVDPDIAISATISPYVNYKHSNVAFSPQNLNDAFSIVDK